MILDITNTNTSVIYLNEKTKNRSSDYLNNLKFKNLKMCEGIKSFNPQIGSAKSHKKIMEENIENVPFIILEEDIVPYFFVKNIEVPLDADAIYLGISNIGWNNNNISHQIEVNKINDSIYRIYGMLTAHAILYLSQDYVKTCIRVINYYLESGNHFDMGLADIHKYYNIYALNKPLFYQDSRKNDLLTKHELNTLSLIQKGKK